MVFHLVAHVLPAISRISSSDPSCRVLALASANYEVTAQ